MLKLYWLLVIFAGANISIICLVEARPDYTIEIINSSMKIIDANVVKTFNHRIYDYKKIYVEFSLYKAMPQFDVEIKFSVITKDERLVALNKFNFDGCKGLSMLSQINFLKIIFKELLRVSNLPRKCPLLVNKIYTIRNYTLRDNDYPPFAPSMQWQVNADVYTKKKRVTEVIIRGRIRKL